MLTDIPGLGVAAMILAVLVFAWCFIFTACYAAFRIALRNRVPLNARSNAAAANYLDSDGFSPAQERTHARWRSESRSNRQPYGTTSIKAAPGPRDWEPRG